MYTLFLFRFVVLDQFIHQKTVVALCQITFWNSLWKIYSYNGWFFSLEFIKSSWTLPYYFLLSITIFHSGFSFLPAEKESSTLVFSTSSSFSRQKIAFMYYIVYLLNKHQRQSGRYMYSVYTMFFFLRELWLEENCKLRSVRRKMRVCAIERIKHF